jgi:hypothetical protein
MTITAVGLFVAFCVTAALMIAAVMIAEIILHGRER